MTDTTTQPAAQPLAEPTPPAAPVVAPTTAPADDPTVSFSIYDGTTGKVRIRGFAPHSMVVLQPRADSEGILFESLSSKTQYVDVSVTPHVSKSRPILSDFDKKAIKADSTDAATLNLPIACSVIVDGVAHPCEAGPLVFTADSPGTYTFTVDQFPYQLFNSSVVAA